MGHALQFGLRVQSNAKVHGRLRVVRDTDVRVCSTRHDATASSRRRFGRITVDRVKPGSTRFTLPSRIGARCRGRPQNCAGGRSADPGQRRQCIKVGGSAPPCSRTICAAVQIPPRVEGDRSINAALRRGRRAPAFQRVGKRCMSFEVGITVATCVCCNITSGSTRDTGCVAAAMADLPAVFIEPVE